ncbi:ABC transporter ATP-binding protein [Ferdinandcohnia quinoae]|uniref:ABC transporter ATP-binding protein n=1 Tax=Fredinandcohnia quinoae TaxID=2918902 RepID=A0AAW5EDY1_9BACI|nr:ABC transporter ATP-binding protein [Fredinandcohnia sp. SECRCQ15]MCH1627671.1 ABC transporter ATP-binding protein [Fredinandcohnia sp. SECRCQ15]
MITLKNVTKKYQGRLVVNNFSLTLESGRIIGLLGSNGSGKSTTLKMIAGLVQPTSGSILINNEKLSRRSCRDIAYLSEHDTLYPFFTVIQIVQFYASQFKDFSIDKAIEILQFLNVNPSDKVKHLSKGSKGRVKIALTLARKAPFLLMDEPLSGLDPMVRESILKGLISFLDIENQTLIISTHEVNEVEFILDSVILIKNGNLIDFIDVDTLREREGKSVLEWMKQNFTNC